MRKEKTTREEEEARREERKETRGREKKRRKRRKRGKKRTEGYFQVGGPFWFGQLVVPILPPVFLHISFRQPMLRIAPIFFAELRTIFRVPCHRLFVRGLLHSIFPFLSLFPLLLSLCFDVKSENIKPRKVRARRERSEEKKERRKGMEGEKCEDENKEIEENIQRRKEGGGKKN
jgi:hypothetical protein